MIIKTKDIMKTILGLDLGTNSIGWALIEESFKNKQGRILGMGSRIIPMSQILGDFERGNTVSQTGERTRLRGVRRLRERHLLRRERLHRVLNILSFLPQHYADNIDFTNKLGKFINDSEPKLPYNNGFIFMESFEEMLSDFRENQPDLLKDGKLIPHDWTIYYLRKKALTDKITKEEIAWILLNFNQKRGYYQLRGEEEEENPNKLEEFYSLKVVEVVADDKPNSKGDLWYSLHLENGWIYRRSSKTPLFDWKDKVRDFIVTTDINDDGTIKTDKEGNEKRSFRAPAENDWGLVKKKTEKEIETSNKTVGQYIYDTLLQKPNQKIKGKLVRTIERKYYKKELNEILKKQIELQPELFTEELFIECIRELYRNNDAHRQQLSSQGFLHLFVKDIIFYQRPLKSQKSNIGRCSLEYRQYRVKDENGNYVKDDNGAVVYKKEYLRAIPKSHPLFQEFRIWQWIYNLKIYRSDDNTNVTSDFISSNNGIDNLFEYLNEQKTIKQEALIKFLLLPKGLKGKALTNEVSKYRWNFVEDKEYPCNETRAQIKSRLSKVKNIGDIFYTSELETKLWHILYSVTDKIEFEKALAKFANKNNLDIESFVDSFKKFKPFDSEYGAFSLKAISKLLPLMRCGKYWDESDINKDTKERAASINERLEHINFNESEIDLISDDDIQERVLKSFINKRDLTQGLQLYQASYLAYGRHSEAEIAGKWNSVEDLEAYLKEFKQHSLRNPIVEQVITETLRVVKDIWVKYGKGANNFFDEIHIELGREMKNTVEERKRMTSSITDNENTNLRIKYFLSELINDTNVENVRPYSPMQQEALKIYEDGVLRSGIDIPEDILKISKTAQPTKSEFQRYKLWLEQKYISPYTGEIIPLNKLFTPAYEIEHVIPQSRYFDDSFSNKIICESEVNKLKDNQLGLEFIKNHHGTIVTTTFGKTVKILSEEAYVDFIKQNYKHNYSKRTKLLMDEIPEKMIERQLNDTRYISKFISQLLSNIVRAESNDDGINSKNILPGNGKVTNILKQDWGLNDVWNDLILPRFERMNHLTNSTEFTSWNDKHQKFLPTVPLELSKGFQKKRIDHRHHAMDALVIACATRDHINLLNNQSSKSDTSRFDLQHKLRHKASYFNEKQQRQRDAFKEFIKPWDTFTQDARHELNKIVVSFKQNLRVINKTSNKYQKYVEVNGRMVKQYIPQTKGDSWAIRKSLHKDTVSGEIVLRKIKEVSLSAAIDEFTNITNKSLRRQIDNLIKNGYDKKRIVKFFKDIDNKWNGENISRVDIYYLDDNNVASRVNLDISFSSDKIIKTVTDTGIQKILLAHLEKYKGVFDNKGKEVSPESLAFTAEGIDEMNKNIVSLNEGRFHQPIYKVRTYEPKGNKYPVGYTGNKKSKFVEAAKGTNLFFAIYQDESGKRNYETIPLNIVVERQKQGLLSVPETNEKGDKLLFHLSPNDLVYVLNEDEVFNLNNINTDNIYKMVSSTGKVCHFIPAKISSLIKNYDAKTKIGEIGSLNKQETTINTEVPIRIKETCIKLKVDRLGNISQA